MTEPALVGAPFQADVAAVRDLVVDVAAEGVQLGSRAPRVSDDTVAEWIATGSARVMTRLWGYGQLNPGLARQVEAASRGLVEMYAAAMLSDANHPERAGTQSMYGRLLMDRFNVALADMATFVQAQVTEMERSGVEDPGLDPAQVANSGSAAKFPSRLAPRFTRYTRF